jgi:hypothetical protein
VRGLRAQSVHRPQRRCSNSDRDDFRHLNPKFDNGGIIKPEPISMPITSNFRVCVSTTNESILRALVATQSIQHCWNGVNRTIRLPTRATARIVNSTRVVSIVEFHGRNSTRSWRESAIKPTNPLRVLLHAPAQQQLQVSQVFHHHDIRTNTSRPIQKHIKRINGLQR